NAVELADPQLGDDVLVVGTGFMGALILKLMGLRGPRLLIAADTRPSALELASRLGATHTVEVIREPLAERVKSLTERPPSGVFGWTTWSPTATAWTRWATPSRSPTTSRTGF